MPANITLNNEAIKQAIAETLNNEINIPADHKGALVTYIDTDRARLAAAFKINDNWNVEIIGDHEWTGNNTVGVISKLTW